MTAYIAGLYRHAGGAMLRAAALPLDHTLEWPDMTDPGSCRAWLTEVWSLPGFADAARYASVSLAGRVEAIVAGVPQDPKKVRAATLSAMRYLLRTVGRPTPFGLFAGVAAASVAPTAQVRWGNGHRALMRAGTLWLDDLIGRLEMLPSLLARLQVVVSDLVTDRGRRIEVPRGPGRVTVRQTALVRLVRRVAKSPITMVALIDAIAGQFPDAATEKIYDTLTDLVRHGILISNLRAPITEPDPLGHLLEELKGVGAGLDEVKDFVAQLGAVQALLARHNDADPEQQVGRRAEVIAAMRDLSTAGRSPIAGDLHLNCQVSVPEHVATEMAAAAGALVHLTRQPRVDRAWEDWAREFWERYGDEAIVPVTEAIHPDAGLGLPAGFPGSMYPETGTAKVMTRRDQELLRLAWVTIAAGHRELVLTDHTIATLTAEVPIDERYAPPHLELAARIRAESPTALDDGDYEFTIRPAWTLGALTARFGPTVPASGFDTVYAGTPANIDGALSVQMSFPPLYPHSENVCRIPAHLPNVLPLGEHRGDDPNLIRVDDLGIVAAPDGLHLVSISRRRVIEPHVLHALALAKQAPPLARFLAVLSRGFRARLTVFDWGPMAEHLPYLPRVRYGRAILSPATWRITAADYATMNTHDFGEALTRWRRRWQCPPTVELYGDDRSLRLTLTVAAHRTLLAEHLHQHGTATLIETDRPADTGWIDGHIHEIILPFVRDRPPTADQAVIGYLPVVTNTSGVQVPGSPAAGWLYAQLFTAADRIGDILAALPGLLAELDDPVFWFARYRSIRETDHLRLRLRVDGPDAYAATVAVVGRWAEQLCARGAASRLTLDTYRPEIGRYGDGPATAAAEVVFAADSRAVLAAQSSPAARSLDPQVLAAIGMAEITDAFLGGGDVADGWLLDRLSVTTESRGDRSAAAQALTWAHHRIAPDGLAPAWRARRDALVAYRSSLAVNANHTQILSGLLHMHHNRARGVDRDDEAACQLLTRRIALARRARRHDSGTR